MAKEIERKFLVTGDGWRAGATGVVYRQGYLSAGADAGCTVRARVAGDRAWLTIKGPALRGARDEYEYPIPVGDAEVPLPPWIGLEVTDDPRYTNAALARCPFSRWGRP